MEMEEGEQKDAVARRYAKRKQEEVKRKQEEEKRKKAEEREDEIMNCLRGSRIDLSEDVLVRLLDSGKPLSELCGYTTDDLISGFQMGMEDARKFEKAAKRPRPGDPHEVGELSIANKCFEVPFIGSAHTELFKQLVELRGTMDSGSHYSPYCALVQSSGVGKSRAVLELSRLGVYICYCSMASDSSMAWPPRTVGLANKLVETFTEHGMVYYLRAWLHVLAAHIDSMSAEDWKQQQLAHEDGSPIGSLAEEVLNEWNNFDGQNPYKSQNRDTWNVEACRDVIQAVKKALQKKCMHCAHDSNECPHTRSSVIFAFDEARGLQRRESVWSSMSSSPFYQIRRALRVFFDHKTFFAIMLDTSAKVTNLLPNRRNEDSSRAVSMNFRLAHPIYFLPNMSLCETTPRPIVPDCYKPDHWLKQGRPMWSARLKLDNNASNVKNFALQKLVRTVCGAFEENVPVDVFGGVMTESQAMALLSATAGLSICARSELAEVMSASHMNLILRVSKDRSRIYIGLPYEPILAEGAASALRRSVVQEAALRHLHTACKAGYVTPGPRGEFVAKFILVAAMWDENVQWHLRPIPVEVYLENLLVNDTCDVETFAKVKADCPKGAIVFFNSFVVARQPPNIARLKRAFESGYALMYRAENNAPGVDIIIPLYTPAGMTYIAISVKNLKRSSWHEEASVDKVSAEYTNIEVTDGLTCITLRMSLQEPGMKNRARWVLCTTKKNEVATPNHPYVNLTCFGIDRNYRYLTKEVKELLKALLVTVPDELAGATEQEKRWIERLLREEYW